MTSTSHRLKSFTAALVWGLLAALIGASIASLASHSDPDRFWSALRLELDEVESYSSLSAMTAASDAVVEGQLVSVTISRQIQGDAEEDIVTYARVDLAVTQRLSGRSPEIVALEFLLLVPPDRAAEAVAALSRDLPRGPVVVFLHEKRGETEAGLYRTASFGGLWSKTDRAALDTPLTEAPPATSGAFREDLAGVDNLEELVEVLRGG